jgi:hypothetical protein
MMRGPMLRRLADALLLLADPPLFTIVFDSTGVRVARGRPPAAFVADCADVAAELGLDHGALHGVRRAGRVVLRFANVPAHAHQRLRNVFGVHAAGKRG